MRRLALLGVVAMLAATPMAARAGDGIDLGTIVGAGLGGVIGNQIGKGTGKTVATVAGVILGGVAGHHVDRSWNGGSAVQRRTVSYYQPAPVYSGYQPNYVAPYAPPPTIIHSEYYEERHRPHRPGYGHGYGKGNGRHEDPAWQRPVVRQVVRIESGAVQRVAAHAVVPERYCREYTNRVVVGGRVQESYGNACMQPDGSWQVVD